MGLKPGYHPADTLYPGNSIFEIELPLGRRAIKDIVELEIFSHNIGLFRGYLDQDFGGNMDQVGARRAHSLGYLLVITIPG